MQNKNYEPIIDPQAPVAPVDDVQHEAITDWTHERFQTVDQLILATLKRIEVVLLHLAEISATKAFGEPQTTEELKEAFAKTASDRETFKRDQQKPNGHRRGR